MDRKAKMKLFQNSKNEYLPIDYLHKHFKKEKNNLL